MLPLRVLLHSRLYVHRLLVSPMALLRSCPRPLSPLLPLLLLATLRLAWAQLLFNYYDASCPGVEDIVKNRLADTLLTAPGSPSALLRLLFHDCQVQGCDASVMLTSGPGVTPELDAEQSIGIRHFDIINNLKAVLENTCPGVVSCADIIALAARSSINLVGAPFIPIPLGRRDSTTASTARAAQELPFATISVPGSIQLFAAMGMSVAESVAMLGGHTLGNSHCKSFVNRLYPTPDPTLGPGLYDLLTLRCPVSYSSSTVVRLDLTNAIFDNQYFIDIVNEDGLLTIDQAIGLDPSTAPIVSQFASDTDAFFQTFSSAFVKLSSFNVLTGSQGEVRRVCSSVN